jgi:hydrophobic/amphiphilic exporter-1 (mainly G- bacteria), HAE1 family
MMAAASGSGSINDRWFNHWFGRATDGYVNWCSHLIRKAGFSIVLLLVVAVFAGLLGSRLPSGFLPEEDQGYFFLNVQLPTAASLQRTGNVAKHIDGILKETPGVQTFNIVIGFSLLSFVSMAPRWQTPDRPPV